MGRKKRLALNTATSLFYQITALICGFILPRMILSHFGSQINGLVNSITQFLSIISFLELGVGAVVQSSLYKPLADKDNTQISSIIHSAERFFVKIALILLCYIVFLIIFYPLLVNKDFERLYTATLILAISISFFAQYYFGVVDRLLLTADQRGYIQYIAQIITLILNVVFCVILIELGAGIHFIKLTTSVVYLLRPIYLRYYVRNHYNINRKIKYSIEPIQQKWNGVAQHVAHVILNQTDIIILTTFSTLTNVSIYSIYYMVVYGVKNLFLSLMSGFHALIGELMARNEEEKLKRFFYTTEWIVHTGTTFIFGCTGVLVIPFVEVYTDGIKDADYIVPLFAVLITVAHAGHCLRLPYNSLILAAGHYKQTQSNYIIAALMNIIISILTVKRWGLIGVAIGTLCAMFYQTVWMAIYDSRHILNFPMKNFVIHIVVDFITVLIAAPLTIYLPLKKITYTGWIVLAIKDAAIWIAVGVIVNLVFYKKEVLQCKETLIKKFISNYSKK